MQPTSETDYKKLFSQLIKKQMLVLGPDITLAKVRNVAGLTVDQNGEVVSLNGDAQQMLQTLINQFVELSGMIVKKTMESILASYPGMMGLAAAPMMAGVPAPQISTTDTSSQVSSAQIPTVTPVIQPEPEKPREEPLPMTSMPLESLSTPSGAKTEEKSDSKSFTQDEMASLNKALEELSKAPLSTDNPSQQTQSSQ